MTNGEKFLLGIAGLAGVAIGLVVIAALLQSVGWLWEVGTRAGQNLFTFEVPDSAKDGGIVTPWVDNIVSADTTAVIVFIVTSFLLVVISYGAFRQVQEIRNHSGRNIYIRRSHDIAILIGIALVVFLFKQSFLNEFFGDTDASAFLKSILIGGGAAAGWSMWYVRQLEKYGEFFHILLLVVAIGFSWYARLTAPEEVQLSALVFILASLLRVGIDYVNMANKTTSEGDGLIGKASNRDTD